MSTKIIDQSAKFLYEKIFNDIKLLEVTDKRIKRAIKVLEVRDK